MSDSLPQFDPETRTLKTRFELDNPGNVLRPDMYVDVEIQAEMPEAVTVPADAIVDSGLRKIVFVDRGNGHFEPRRVETGWRVGDRVQVSKGLMAGERIVISGTFLIDSESRMKTAAMGMLGAPATDVVCGMDVDPKKATSAGRTAVHEGETYYFCSDECKQKFAKEPAKYVAK
jgi:multidrug efflux pump subunit AcrA (membrane-fusion protein)/YHS domain-containing protein